jgi:pyruvate/2-oxoglutarate dehydrogenase complex dihydrolipoamide acyltransferase (E2) component
MSNLRVKVKELAEVAALVPENLQTTCFEILLRDYLASLSNGGAPPPKQKPDAEAAPAAKGIEDPEKSFQEAAKAQADVTLADLHVKARKFLEKHGISISEINNLFYKEGTVIKPLYEDLKTTRMSEAQIRVTLLQALLSALSDGEFIAQVENVRTECRDRKSLDVANFAANYKNNDSLFDFNKYDKDTKSLRLSENGRKELAQLIKEFQ